VSAALLGGQVREVRLYGHLAERFGRVHQLAVESPAEAVRALCVLFKGFRDALVGFEPGYTILVGRGKQRHDRGEDDLHLSAGSADLIRIVPVVTGAKKGWGRIIVGLVLVVVAYYTWSPQLAQLGWAMVLGGVIQLLSPQRQGNSKTENEASYALDGPVNTTASGGPVALIFGRMVIGSSTISAGLSTDDLMPPPVFTPPAPVLPGWEPTIPLNDGQ
jgi:predicted phage tail protein